MAKGPKALRANSQQGRPAPSEKSEFFDRKNSAIVGNISRSVYRGNSAENANKSMDYMEVGYVCKYSAKNKGSIMLDAIDQTRKIGQSDKFLRLSSAEKLGRAGSPSGFTVHNESDTLKNTKGANLESTELDLTNNDNSIVIGMSDAPYRKIYG
jgi:hypothetical protein